MRHVVPGLAMALCLAGPALADATRTHKLDLSGDPGSLFVVENLAGAMTIKASSTGRATVSITVHGEDQAAADSIRLVQDVDKNGRPRLLVKYPVDRHTRYRYPGSRDHGDDDDSSSNWAWLASMFGGNGSNMEYDGRRVSVGGSGLMLYADVQVEVPPSARATFKNHVGPLRASAVSGDYRFDTGSGNISLDDVKGTTVADTGSGDVHATRISGASFKCDTGSGNCNVKGFEGDRIDCDTGSGNVNVQGSTARTVRLDTGSGDVSIHASGVEDIEADTGSGNVELTVAGNSLRRVKADTGSGDVTLRLAPDASFEVHADLGSGDIENHYADAQPIVRGREVTGYRRGDAAARIEVDTGSGDLVLEPAR
jgi:hypothetical protein